jgi:hypothetical protein
MRTDMDEVARELAEHLATVHDPKAWIDADWFEPAPQGGLL